MCTRDPLPGGGVSSPPGGFLYKRGSIAAIFQLSSSELYSQHLAIGIARRSIFDSEVPIVNVEKRYSDSDSRLRNRRISAGRHRVGHLVGGLPRSRDSEVPFYRGGICDSATSVGSFPVEELLTLTYTGR